MPFKVFESVADVTIPSGQQESEWVSVSCPVSGAIHKVAARQISGANVGFTVYVVSRENITNLADAQLFSVIPALSVASGTVGQYFSDHGHPYTRVAEDYFTAHNGLFVKVRAASTLTETSVFRVSFIMRTSDE